MIDRPSSRAIRLAVAAAIPALLCACSSAPPPPPEQGAPPAASSPQAPPASASAAAPPAAAPSLPTARVVAIEPSKESIDYVRAKVLFENGTPHACKLTRYTLSWATFKKSIPLDRFGLPPGEGRERWIRVNHDDGDLKALTITSARVEVEGDCKGG